MPYDDNHRDFQAENWWTTVSGVDNWADDYTRHRDGVVTHSGSTYGEVDMYNHSGDNHPADVVIGRKDSILDVNP